MTVADLVDDDRLFWTENYGSLCPGVAEGRFFDEATTSFGILLVRGDGARRRERLLVAEAGGSGRDGVQMLVPSAAATHPSVISRVPAAGYKSTDEPKLPGAKHDMLLYQSIEAGLPLYYWDGDGFEFIVGTE